MDSILTSIKRLLSIEEGYEHFDQELIIHINSVFMVLNQLGIGDKSGFSITGKDETWVNLLQKRKDLDAIKTYVYLKVRLVFDPPQNSFLVESINKQCTELEWRLNVEVEGGPDYEFS